jgi:hypothetical protein
MTKNNYTEDLVETKKLNTKFKLLLPKLPNVELYQKPKAKTYLGHGADVIYTCELNMPKMAQSTKDKIGIGDSIIGYIWLSSDINPNGITSKDDIGRTYNIHIEFKGRIRIGLRSWDNNGCFIKCYEYGRTIEEVIEKFQIWYDIACTRFIKDIETKKYHWKTNSNYKINTNVFYKFNK